MTDADVLHELIAKLEKATEPSRELDARVHVAVVNPMVMTDGGGWKGKPPAVWRLAQQVFNDDWNWEKVVAGLVAAPAYTSSLDAMLPGEDAGYWIIQGPHKERWHACYHPPGTGAGWDGEGRTEASARHAAYLKARLADMEARSDG